MFSAGSFKALAGVTLFFMAAVGGLIPMRLRHLSTKVVSSLNIAVGGVFFASSMVDMLPESSKSLEVAWGDTLPWGGLLCSVAFLMILLIDQVVTASIESQTGHHHTALPTELEEGNEKDMDDMLLDASNNGWDDSHTSHNPNITRGYTARDRGGPGTGADDSGSPGALLFPGGYCGSEREEYWNVNGFRHTNGYRRPIGSEQEMGGRQGDMWDKEDGLIKARGHSHELGGKDTGVLTRVALLLALSVHSVMEGLGLGADSGKMYNMLFAIAVHKSLAAYALGTSLLRCGVTIGGLIGYISLFSLMTPMGIWLGTAMRNEKESGAGSACVALAAGTFLYIALMEVLPRELEASEGRLSKFAYLLGGFIVSAVVAVIAG